MCRRYSTTVVDDDDDLEGYPADGVLYEDTPDIDSTVENDGQFVVYQGDAAAAATAALGITQADQANQDTGVENNQLPSAS
ncbi:hypothetical protein BX616_009098, partial [Lobosporangium transversale]